MRTEKKCNLFIFYKFCKSIQLKNIYKIFLGLAVVIPLASCQLNSKNINDKIGKTIEVGKVFDDQKGILDTNINYCFYMPKNYNGIDKLPVIFFLDPHATGKLPITNFAALADKYGYIFVASNTIKNGQAAIFSYNHFQALVSETKHRFNTNEKRMVISGFSGGAKLALIFADQMPEIFGVAACGGSLPFPNDYKPHYYYAGIVGNQDFNYLEIQQTHTLFEQKGIDYTSVIFDGKHEWPPVESFEMALIGFEIHAMKSNLVKKNDKWLESIWGKMNDSIVLYGKNEQALKQYMCLKQSIHWFKGSKNNNELVTQIYQLEKSNAFNTQVNKQQKLIQTEVTLRSEYIRAIELRDLQWWNDEINRIKKSALQNDKEVAQVSRRLLNYLSMVSFMLVKSDLENSQLENAAKKLKIYEWVDPKNPDVYLMYARYYMQLNDLGAMSQNFKKAQELGFKDFIMYRNDDFWKGLMKQSEIKNQ